VREPEEIGKIIARWLRKNRVSERANEEGIYQFWKEIVGEEIASQTRVVKCSGGVLTVEVASAPLLLELSGYYREGILESLRADSRFAGIQKILFRAGSGGEVPFRNMRKEPRIGKKSEEHGDSGESVPGPREGR